jgi:hypothetical protein
MCHYPLNLRLSILYYGFFKVLTNILPSVFLISVSDVHVIGYVAGVLALIAAAVIVAVMVFVFR